MLPAQVTLYRVAIDASVSDVTLDAIIDRVIFCFTAIAIMAIPEQ